MKHLKQLILPFLTLLVIVSCSTDDTTDTPNNTPGGAVEGDYYPSNTENYWKYNVTNTDNATSATNESEDHLNVVSTTGNTLTLDVNNGSPANGPMIGMLASGTLTKTNTALALDGTLELPAEISDLIDFDIALTNFVLFDTDASNNAQLAYNTDTITQDFNGFPLIITYQLTSTALNFDSSLSLSGTTYSNVVSSKMALNIEVSTVVEIVPGFPSTLSILEPQDILVSTNYYANGIGLVQADSETNYEISATAIAALNAAGIPLDIPETGSTTIDQVIFDYNIVE